jgi:hypothetical protein
VRAVSDLALIILVATDGYFAHDGINPQRIIDNARMGSGGFWSIPQLSVFSARGIAHTWEEYARSAERLHTGWHPCSVGRTRRMTVMATAAASSGHRDVCPSATTSVPELVRRHVPENLVQQGSQCYQDILDLGGNTTHNFTNRRAHRRTEPSTDCRIA